MTNNELLLDISNLIDTKFEAMSATIDRKFETISATINKKFEAFENRLETIETDIKDIRFTLENEIEPRLQNIENCYMATYERYQAGVEQIDSMQMDIDILKKVVGEHSKTLEKLA